MHIRFDLFENVVHAVDYSNSTFQSFLNLILLKTICQDKISLFIYRRSLAYA